MTPSYLTTVNTWKECEDAIRQIEDDNSKSTIGVWYRGISKSTRLLTTTLERRQKKPFFVKEYFDLMLKILPEVTTFTGKTWQESALKWEDPKSSFADHFREPAAFSYMAHLRHHGFPSPLLDWTRSPYIAAYFAFARAKPEVGKNVAIFAYSETPNNGKVIASNKPQIYAHGGFGLTTHARHFRQQSCYTACVERVMSDNSNLHHDCEWRFAAHQEVFLKRNLEQDRLYKIEIPTTERINVLSQLNRFNLNDFTLFGSEESLMESLAFRNIDA